MQARFNSFSLIVVLSLLFLSACHRLTSDVKPSGTATDIEYEKYTLNNGLTVILHEDHSDPLVHVDVTYHVGSAREELGKSGFAHFFEHMMFQGSEHVADEMHFKLITEAGGSLNGTTNTDRTNYYQTVPSNQLERVLWLESDRMGFLLPAVTQDKFENQRETVKNERAQRVDNQPYGIVDEKVAQALYPPSHPYSWPTIGYVDDLDRVSVDDLKAFFSRWYGPNNAVLTIGGAIDVEQTKAWVKQYFGEIPRGPEVEKAKPAVPSLQDDRFITIPDSIHLPLIQVTFPTVYARHEDEAALDVLADIIGGGKTSLLYQNLVREGSAVQAVASHPCRELACEFKIAALANPSRVTTLAQLYQQIEATLDAFSERGVVNDDLARVKGQIEASTIYGLQSVAGKVSALAANQTFYNEPDLIQADLNRYNQVTAQDVMRVYQTYIRNAKAVIASVVPNDQSQWQAAQPNFDARKPDAPVQSDSAEFNAQQLQSSFDRSKVPDAGPAAVVDVPKYWQRELTNGILVSGIHSEEVPATTVIVSLEGGMLLDPKGKEGLAALTAAMLNESTESYSSESMSNELAKLGSAVSVSASGLYLQITATSLSKHLDKTLALMQQKLFSPAFLQDEFDTVKSRLMQSMMQQQKSPSAMAVRARDQILFGADNRVSLPTTGTLSSINSITLDDVKAFYQSYLSPAKASVVLVSNYNQDILLPNLAFLETWQGQDYAIPEYLPFPEYSDMRIALVDKPEAVQSVIYVVKRAMPYDALGEYFYARLANFPLGGAFNSRINLNLREDKGITYGANSAFVGGKTLGWFEVSTDVTSQHTALAISQILKEIDTYRQNGMTADEHAFMKSAYTLSDALAYETPASKASFLRRLIAFDLPDDYRQRQLELINRSQRDDLNRRIDSLFSTNAMQIIVVGDKRHILEQLKTLNIPVDEWVLESLN